jgi:hypothetical protein
MAPRTCSLLLLALVLSGVTYAAEPTEGPAVVTSPAAAPSQTAEREDQSTNDAPRQTTRGTGADRLELDTTVVTGNRELPKVLYIVPWKKADLGDLPAQPFNTLLDEVLTPVDRDVFRREVTYYEAVSSGGDASGAASPSPAERTEK